MANVHPFKGLRYTHTLGSSLTDLICPPYDVITEDKRQTLSGRSTYNAIHLELPQGDTTTRYSHAAQTLRQWQEDGVLVEESSPSYYVTRHRFRHEGQTLERWGLTARVRLEEFDREIILPHETTGATPKEDRLRLMEACNMNFSPIMSFYNDPHHQIMSAVKQICQSTATVTATYDGEEEIHLWVVAATMLDTTIQSTLKNAQLFIADGHHRYETALTYRNQTRSSEKNWDEENPTNYVMMTLIDFEDSGLLILPYHRTLGNMSPSTLQKVQARLMEVFELTSFNDKPTTPRDLERIVAQQENIAAIGFLDQNGQGPYLLTISKDEVLRELSTIPGSTEMRDSEGWLLHRALLEPALSDPDKYVTYIHDPLEAWNSVLEHRQAMAFFLKPFPMDLFQAIVSKGHRLPRKSTYFHPKIPTGLVFNRLDTRI
jgi:uncharacterized protein (DUF1015 family)